jgi:hypothetical protein
MNLKQFSVSAGFAPAIGETLCFPDRDGRNKSGTQAFIQVERAVIV